ncbi:MAG: alpha/beta hydrolase [Candidatus Kapaibacterium sp.]
MEDKKYPLLILLPGLDGSVELYEHFCERMRGELEGIVIGYPANYYLDLESLVEYAEARIPGTRPIILMGVSFSGPVAARLLKRRKRNYVAAIFCTTFLTSPHPVLTRLASILPTNIFSYSLKITSIVRLFFYEKKSPLNLIQQFQEANAKLSPHVMGQRIVSLTQVDERSSLRGVEIPCCYLQAENDRIVPAGALKAFYLSAESDSTSRYSLCLLTIAAPHALLQCKPEESWDAIKGFLTRGRLMEHDTHPS